MNIKKNIFRKKAISPVISISLLLIVSVVAVLSFQSWFQTYSSAVFSDVEVRSNVDVGLKIDNLIGNSIYIISSRNDTINKLQINGQECSLSTYQIQEGINKVDLSGCFDFTISVYDILLVTNESIDEKKIYNKNKFPINTLCQDLSLLMHFDNDSSKSENNSFFYDWSGNGNNGNCVGNLCPTYNSTESMFGQSLYLNGSQYLKVLDSSSLNFTDKITVSAWINSRDNSGSWRTILGQSWGSQFSWRLSLKDNFCGYKAGFLVDFDKLGMSINETSDVICADSALNINQWYHLVGVYDGNQFYYYQDGVLINNITRIGVIPTSVDDLVIGSCAQWSSTNEINGYIDDIAIWNRALTYNEINNIYSLGGPINC